MNFKRIGIDLAKNVFQLHGVNEKEETILKKKLKRHQFLHYLLTMVNANCIIAMEACSGSNHWGRRLESAGFTVRIIPAQYVKPYVKRNKNDANDAEAICEAASRPNMHFVPIKTIEQQDMQAIHRARSELVKQRTMKANQIRGLVSEYGIVAPKGLAQLKKHLPNWLEDASNELSTLFVSCYQREHDGERSYSWVKNKLQSADLVAKGKSPGPCGIKRLPQHCLA